MYSVSLFSQKNTNSINFRKNGKECIVKCFQSVIDNPPSIGSIITVKHNGIFNNGTLRNAFYWRERPDISWNSSIDQQSERLMVLLFSNFIILLHFKRFLLQIGQNCRIILSYLNTSNNP